MENKSVFKKHPRIATTLIVVDLFVAVCALIGRYTWAAVCYGFLAVVIYLLTYCDEMID